MAKAKKTKKTKPRAKQYEDKTPVTGSFLQIMQAAGKHANAHSKPEKP